MAHGIQGVPPAELVGRDLTTSGLNILPIAGPVYITLSQVLAGRATIQKTSVGSMYVSIIQPKQEGGYCSSLIFDVLS